MWLCGYVVMCSGSWRRAARSPVSFPQKRATAVPTLLISRIHGHILTGSLLVWQVGVVDAGEGVRGPYHVATIPVPVDRVGISHVTDA